MQAALLERVAKTERVPDFVNDELAKTLLEDLFLFVFETLLVLFLSLFGVALGFRFGFFLSLFLGLLLRFGFRFFGGGFAFGFGGFERVDRGAEFVEFLSGFRRDGISGVGGALGVGGFLIELFGVRGVGGLRFCASAAACEALSAVERAASTSALRASSRAFAASSSAFFAAAASSSAFLAAASSSAFFASSSCGSSCASVRNASLIDMTSKNVSARPNCCE